MLMFNVLRLQVTVHPCISISLMQVAMTNHKLTWCVCLAGFCVECKEVFILLLTHLGRARIGII